MNVVFFSNWEDALLSDDALGGSQRNSYFDTICAYLKYLKRRSMPATVQTARSFLGQSLSESEGVPADIADLKAGLNWFFIHAPVKRPLNSGFSYRDEDYRFERGYGEKSKRSNKGKEAASVAEYHRTLDLNSEILKVVKLMRIRHMSYRTEEAYVQWLRKWDKFFPNKLMEEYGEENLTEFLEQLLGHKSVVTTEIYLHVAVKKEQQDYTPLLYVLLLVISESPCDER